MSRWIDAEWLENNAKEYSLGYYEADEWATPISLLETAPSIDIVRCKECKYRDYWGSCTFLQNKGDAHKPIMTDADDFCSYGMRNADSNTLNTLDALDDNSSEKPNNSTISKMEQVDEPQEICDRPQKDCENCWKQLHCRAKDESQTSGVVWTDNEIPIYHSTTASIGEPQTERNE